MTLIDRAMTTDAWQQRTTHTPTTVVSSLSSHPPIGHWRSDAMTAMTARRGYERLTRFLHDGSLTTSSSPSLMACLSESTRSLCCCWCDHSRAS